MEEFEVCPACETEFPWEEGYHGTPGRVECPECQYDFDAEHDIEYNQYMSNESKVMKNDFDKFMVKLISEQRTACASLTDSPQRRRAALRQERPLGRIRMRVA